MHIPQVDNFEASVPTAPRDLRVGDHIATGWNSYDIVVGVIESASGAHLTLRPPGGKRYEIHRRSLVPVIR